MRRCLYLLFVVVLLSPACSGGQESADESNPSDRTVEGGPEGPSGESTTVEGDVAPAVFETLPPGSDLPDEATCAEWVLAQREGRDRDENNVPNQQVEGPDVEIDGADETWNTEFSPRISGNFSGTTEQILRWGACKWGFDEVNTFGRAMAESSWSMDTKGDDTDDAQLCAIMGLDAPCAQSYGLLQVKGSVHEGTFPASKDATAFGVDYAMAWLRSCYEGSFTWMKKYGDYAPGDEWGCVGAWFSGQWYDDGAQEYLGRVRSQIEGRTWENHQHIK